MAGQAENECTTGASPRPQQKRSTPTFVSLPERVPSTVHRPSPQSNSSTRSEPSPGVSSIRKRNWTRNTASLGMCRVRICAGTASRHRGATRTNGDRALHGYRHEVRVYRLSWRPPACHRRGRSPPNQPTHDRADGATLGRWDAKASQRPRRPVMQNTGTAAPQIRRSVFHNSLPLSLGRCCLRRSTS